jgi:acetyl esterase/lipase
MARAAVSEDRLAPDLPWPCGIEDATALLRWII